MRFDPRYLLLGLCLTLVGASPARETGFSSREQFPTRFPAERAVPALAVGQDGGLCLEAAGRRFEFGEGQLAVSAGDSSWTYRFRGAQGGIRALSISTRPEQTAEGSLEYRHAGGIVERYIVQSLGVEQQFLLPGPYTGGDVLLTGSVQTDLVPDVTSSFEGIAFRRDDSAVLFYGAAKAVDAGGRTALLEERWADGELTIVVPATFLAAARFPVLVDPWIGRQATVDAAVDLAEHPAVATRESATFQALAVWSTDITSPQSIRGRIIGPRGNTLVGPISAVDEFSIAGTTFTKPRVAWSSSNGVWVVAAEGHGAGVANPNFIQVNKVDTSGTKTTGTNHNAVGGLNIEADVDVACNSGGQCLVVWAWDSDGEGTTDSIKGVLYTVGTNTFGSLFDIVQTTFAEHSHPRVASNGTNYYVVFEHNEDNVDGYSVTSGGAVSNVDPVLTGTVFKHPAVSYNSLLDEYLVVWDDGSLGTSGSILSGATPPVTMGSAAGLVFLGQKAEVTSQQYMGWELSILEIGGSAAGVALVRPNLGVTFGGLLDSTGGIPGAALSHFYRGLTVVVYEDDRGSTDHDIRAREFISPATEYADFDNDGYASAFVWRPGTNAYFYYSNDVVGAATSVQFGTTGDIPVRTDYDGDGIPDLTVFRPSSGYWYIDTDRNGTVNTSIQFGASGDIPVPGDYDRDGRTDLAVFRPSNGTWYIRFTATAASISVQFGASGDIPVPADYDGGFKTDLAVWRPSTGFWYVDTDLNGTVNIQAQFGTAGDIPVPGDYGPSNGSNAPDGRAEFAVFRPSTGYWYVSRNRDGVVSQATPFGTAGDIPVGGIYDSNPSVNSPFAVFRPSNGTWYVDTNNNGTVDFTSQFGTAGDVPMQQPSGQYRN